DPVRVVLVPFTGIMNRADIVDRVLRDHPVAGIVERRIRRHPFIADGIDSDVVIVVNQIGGDRKVCYVAIYVHSFAVSRLAVVDGVPADRDVADRGGGFRTVNGNAERVSVLLGRGGNVGYRIVYNLDVSARTRDP